MTIPAIRPSPLAGAEGRIEGYACLFEEIDLGRDVIERGAFAQTLATRGVAGVRLLYQHDPAEPIGIWTEMREDARGLFVRGRLALEVQRAREVQSLIRDGALDGLSIGFKAVRARTDPRTRVRRLSRIDLWEVSVVTFPMQPGARLAAPSLPRLTLAAAPAQRSFHDRSVRPRDQGDRPRRCVGAG